MNQDLIAEPNDVDSVTEHQSSVLHQYVLDLIAAGKTQQEVSHDIERYYLTLTNQCDREIQQLQDQIQYEKALQREEAAEDVYLKANELDYLSDMFVECVYAQRKSLRQKLVSMRVNGQSQAKPTTLL